jgi:outer membrane protein OmpA-like peptidoglycan-associated protein
MFAPPIRALKAKTASRTVPTRAPKPPQDMPLRPGAGLSDQAMLRLLQSEAQRAESPSGCTAADHHQTREADRGRTASPKAARSTAWDFSKIPVLATERPNQPQTPSQLIQLKLAIGQINNPLEQEADRVADQVMRTPEPQPQGSCGGGCPECQADKLSQGTEYLQRNSGQSGGTEGTAVPPIVHEVLSSAGRPLDPAVRSFVESRFGHDFRQVQVHTDSEAADSAKALNARAFTNGRHIVFGRGEYAAGTMDGKRTIAHELAHVVQQETTGWHRSGQGTERKPSEQVMRKVPDPKRSLAPAVEPKIPAKSWLYPDDPTGHVASIYFETASSNLDVDDLAKLEQVGPLLEDPLTTGVTFEGYSDAVGDPVSNQALSKQRAVAVADRFDLPTPHPTVKVTGFGEQGPESTGKNADELSHYRRVDVIIVPPRPTTPYEPPQGIGAQHGSSQLQTALPVAVNALNATLDALYHAIVGGMPTQKTTAALERYFPHPRYRSTEFMNTLVDEISHIRKHIESIYYFEIQKLRDIYDNCRQSQWGPVPNWDDHFCTAVNRARDLGRVAFPYPFDAPDRIVLTPLWYGHHNAALVLVHELAHMLLGLRGHPTEVPHRNPYAIQDFVAALGGPDASGSDERYPD